MSGSASAATGGVGNPSVIMEGFAVESLNRLLVNHEPTSHGPAHGIAWKVPRKDLQRALRVVRFAGADAWGKSRGGERKPSNICW